MVQIFKSLIDNIFEGGIFALVLPCITCVYLLVMKIKVKCYSFIRETKFYELAIKNRSLHCLLLSFCLFVC